MKYFFDTEFIEGFKKPLFDKRRHFIDLISIGIVCEDGRTYYAVSNEFNPKNADKWVTENILDKIELEFYHKQSPYAKSYHWESLKLKNFLKWYGKSNKRIANDIIAFVYPDIFKNFTDAEDEFISRTKEYGWNTEKPEFYAYYADYDWVVFCSLFGRMIDLPKEFPMYCVDLKQYIDDAANKFMSFGVGTHTAGDKVYPDNFEMALDWVKSRRNYPKQENEHNALDDAKWNYELYKFLQTI